MNRYFHIANEIFQWLGQNQVIQNEIKAKQVNGDLKFSLEHPAQGCLPMKTSLWREKIFRCGGIAMQVAIQNGEEVELEVYDHGGIWDPVDELVPGDHYATTHFALLGAILYQENPDDYILEKVRNSIEFHLRTLKDEYYFGDYGYHWDFQNYAFLETYKLLANVLSLSEKQMWRQGIKKSHENSKNRHTNWIAMRAYSSLLKSRLFHSPFDMIDFLLRIKRVHKARKADGCYDDFPNISRPIQYHVYTIGLLHRVYLLKPNDRLKKYILDGINYFTKFIDPDGCFNYLGRGQEQIFGYAVAMYLLEAAKKLDPSKFEYYQEQAEKVWKYLLQFKKEGYFPLVLNKRKDEDRFGWYDYHHLTVYNAFLGVWLGFTGKLFSDEISSPIENVTLGSEFFEYFNPTKIFIKSTSEYYFVITGGTPDYLSEAGLSPVHIWFKSVGWIFSCPGGPSINKFGKLFPVPHIEKNYFAPLILSTNGEWLIPAKKEFEIRQADANCLEIFYDYGPFSISRKIEFEEELIKFQDVFRFTSGSAFAEVRYFNFPIVVDKYKMNFLGDHVCQLISLEGGIYLQILESDFPAKSFELGEEIKTAMGLANNIILREGEMQFFDETIMSISFSISKEKV